MKKKNILFFAYATVLHGHALYEYKPAHEQMFRVIHSTHGQLSLINCQIDTLLKQKDALVLLINIKSVKPGHNLSQQLATIQQELMPAFKLLGKTLPSIKEEYDYFSAAFEENLSSNEYNFLKFNGLLYEIESLQQKNSALISQIQKLIDEYQNLLTKTKKGA